MKNAIITIVISSLLIVIDLVTKYLFYDLWYWNNSFIQKSCNTGIAFSIEIDMIIIIIISLVFLIILFYLFIKKQISYILFSLLFAWAIWNLYDRVFFWCVRDFLVMPNMFIFNFADLFISISFIIVFIQSFFIDDKNDNKWL